MFVIEKVFVYMQPTLRTLKLITSHSKGKIEVKKNTGYKRFNYSSYSAPCIRGGVEVCIGGQWALWSPLWVPERALEFGRYGGTRPTWGAADRDATVRGRWQRRRHGADHLAAHRLRTWLSRRAALHVAFFGARARHRFPRLPQKCRSPRTTL